MADEKGEKNEAMSETAAAAVDRRLHEIRSDVD